MKNLERLERAINLLVGLFLVAIALLGFMVGTLVSSKVAKAEQAKAPVVLDWETFYNVHPEFPATDSLCAYLENKATQEGLSLEEAYRR